MPIVPEPSPGPLAPPIPDHYADATFYDVTLGQMMAAIIASGQYAPGQLVTDLALAATAEMMYQTGRWNRNPGVNPQLGSAPEYTPLTPEAAANVWGSFRIKGS